MELRRRTATNWRHINIGEPLPPSILRSRSRPTRQLLDGTFTVDRLISRRITLKDEEYLVQWVSYQPYECTWEPAHHLPAAVLDHYRSPAISQDRLKTVAAGIEEAFQTILRTDASQVAIQVPLDVYRYAFSSKVGHDKEVFLGKDDFNSLGMSPCWWYRLASTGQGVKIDFPVRVKPRLTMKQRHVFVEGEMRSVLMPREVMLVYCVTRACDTQNLLS